MLRILVLLVIASSFVSCNNKKSVKKTLTLNKETRSIDKTAYALGVQYAKGMKDINFDKNSKKHFIQGLQDYFQNKAQLDNNDVQVYAKKIDKILIQKRKEMSKSEIVIGEKFTKKLLAENLDFKRTKSGLIFRVLKKGITPDKIAQSSFLEMHYESSHLNDKQYESTKSGNKRNLPYKGIFPAWQEAFRLAGTDSEIEIIAPPHLTYGNNGAQPYIKAGEFLKFKIQFFKYYKNKP